MKAANFVRSIVLVLTFLPFAACGGPPPGLEGTWHRYRSARGSYESCTEQHPRQPSACTAERATFLAALARYHAALKKRQAAAAR